MPETETPKIRRKRYWVGLLLLAAAGAAYYLSSSGSADPLFRAGPAPRTLGQGVAVGARPRTPSLFPVGGRRLTLKGLLKMLHEQGSPEAARRVLAAIEGDPVLKQAYDKLVAERGEDVPLDDFLDRVRETPQYREETEKLLADPEVRGALARVAKETGVQAFVGAAGQPAAEGRQGSSSLIRPMLSAAPSSGFTPLRAVGRLAKAGSPGAKGQSFFGGSTPVLTEPVVPRRADSEAPPPIGEAKNGTHGVEKLALIKPAGPASDVARFLSSTFSEMPKDKRDILLKTCEVDDVCEAAPACVKANIVADCEAACRASPKCGRGFPAALETAVAQAAVAQAAAQSTDECLRSALPDGAPCGSPAPQPSADGAPRPPAPSREPPPPASADCVNPGNKRYPSGATFLAVCECMEKDGDPSMCMGPGTCLCQNGNWELSGQVGGYPCSCVNGPGSHIWAQPAPGPPVINESPGSGE